MKILRRLSIWAIYSLFFGSLFVIAYGTTFNETAGKRVIVKSWFEESGIYTSFVDEIVSLSQSQAAEAQSPIDGRILSNAANEAFPPKLLQASLESVLDGGYDWLREVEPQIEFTVDFTESKLIYASAISRSASDRVDSLPVCPGLPTGGDFDPFNADCRPAGLDFAPLISNLQQQVLDDENFFPDPVFTGANITIPSGGSQQRLDAAAAQAPTIFRYTQYAPFIALLTAFTAAIGLIIISRSKTRAVFTLFRATAYAAISLVIFTFISSRSTNWIDSILADPSATGFTQRIVYPFVDLAVMDITRWTTYFIFGYGALAASLLIVYLMLRHNTKSKSRLDEPPSPPMSLNN